MITIPTHFIDGEPIPPGYFELLALFTAGMDEITEDNELEYFTFDPVTQTYIPNEAKHAL